MTRKTILLITDDHKTETAVKETLGKHYGLETAKDKETAAALLAKKLPDLAIIDFDLKGEDGLQIYKNLGLTVKTIMLSASGSIPLAVSATKLGVEEFLRKPIDAEHLQRAVETNLPKEEVKLRWPEGLEWLRGESPGLKKMLSEIQEILRGNKDVILVGERGIPKEQIAELIHLNGPRKERKLARVDLAAFRKEALEAHFWTTIQELMAIPAAAGTIYLDTLHNLDELFLLSVFNFFHERPNKIDKSIRAIIGVYNKSQAQKAGKNYVVIEVPKLRDRKADLPYLVEFYLASSARKHGKNIKYLAADVLDLLAAYDYPGNYLELERLIEEAVLSADSDKLELKNFPVDLNGLVNAAQKKGLSEDLPLEKARQVFERKLYAVLLEKAKGETAKVARFLDVPKTALTDRLDNLFD
ncbi:MAG: response regulator [Candidatus Margulisbacteria bacterium]|nr:response regulator [Candidatus Margulisiibacteriota bacterium]